LIVLTVLVAARRGGLDTRDVRTLTFTTLISANLALIFTNRSLTQTFFRAWFAPNPALWWLIAAAVLLLGFVLAVPVVRDLFQLARPHWNDLLTCAIAAIVAMFAMDGIKIITRRMSR
jgi:Ca2+-transporting ATPase